MAPKDFTFAIIGGGISGLTLAIALYKRGITVKIYEQAPAFGEIGAGVSFQPNAIQSMKICDPDIHAALERVQTRNLWPSKQDVWFDYYDAYNHTEDPEHQRPAFTIKTPIGQCGVHRARFLDELVKLIPQDIAVFGKHLETIDESGDRYILKFADGTSAEADAVLACDGIKSKVRSYMFGADHPCAKPGFSGKIAYRALVPMEDAKRAIGAEKAENACMHMGPGAHVLTFPVNSGKTMNVVAFKTTGRGWSDPSKLVAPAKREDALKDFSGYGTTVTTILRDLVLPDLDVWAIFDTWDNPVPSFTKGRICLVGDSAHASSPHHGAGAGMCIEDAAVMAELLADERVKTRADVTKAFDIFNTVRKERGQWLVRQSRHIGDCYEWRAEGVDNDLAKIEYEINKGNAAIGQVDVSAMCRKARDLLDTPKTNGAHVNGTT